MGVSCDRQNDKPIYIVRDHVFAGNTMIDVISTSLGVDVARRNSVDFVDVLEIDDFAPPPPAPRLPLPRPHRAGNHATMKAAVAANTAIRDYPMK